MSAKLTYYQNLLRWADKLRKGLISEEEYCKQVTLLAAEFCYPSFLKTKG
jgi:hypothetical protein